MHRSLEAGAEYGTYPMPGVIPLTQIGIGTAYEYFSPVSVVTLLYLSVVPMGHNPTGIQLHPEYQQQRAC